MAQLAIMAPHSLPQTTIILPLPKLNNQIISKDSVEVKEFMNGDLATYVKSTSRRQFSFSFELTQHKCEELRRFFEAYVAEQWRVYLWTNEVWVLTPTVPEFIPVTVAVAEYKEVSLELEGFRL